MFTGLLIFSFYFHVRAFDKTPLFYSLQLGPGQRLEIRTWRAVWGPDCGSADPTDAVWRQPAAQGTQGNWPTSDFSSCPILAHTLINTTLVWCLVLMKPSTGTRRQVDEVQIISRNLPLDFVSRPVNQIAVWSCWCWPNNIYSFPTCSSWQPINQSDWPGTLLLNTFRFGLCPFSL